LFSSQTIKKICCSHY